MVIGGGAAGAGNLVSGNIAGGISIGAPGNLLQGNYVGTDASGSAPIPNGGHGVFIESSDDNTIGGPSPGEGNAIAFHPFDGVFVSNAAGNAIRGNSIFENGDLGIDLASNGVTPNDAGDGGRRHDGSPELAGADVHRRPGSAGLGHTLPGILHSAPSTTYDLDFYENPPCAVFPREFVEGRIHLGSGQVSTNGAGAGAFDVTLPATATAGARFAATATGPRETRPSSPSGSSSRSLRPPGPPGGGSNVVIVGTDFAAGAGVTIGGQPATSVAVTGFTAITAATPALTAGSANDVVVSNTDGSSGTLARGWVADFLDVPAGHQFHAFVAMLVSTAITAGIGGGLYGVSDDTLRQQMAVFLLKA